MQQLPRSFFCIIILMSFCLVGCGSGNKRRPVSGTVRFKGELIENGNITFLTTSGPPGPAGGALIRDGKFHMPAEMGLEPGVYRISISYPKGVGKRTQAQIEANASAPAKELIPPEYNSESTITIEVKKDGPNEFHWSID